MLLALLGLGWLALTLLARTRHKPRQKNKIADRLADRKLAPCSRLRVQGRSYMAARGVAGVAWLGLADLNVAGANQAQTKAKEQNRQSSGEPKACTMQQVTGARP